MRVGKTGGTKGPEGRGSVRRGGGGAGFKLDEGPSATESLAPLPALGAPGAPGLGESLLALEERKQAVARGKASLECLDRLRLDILEGRLSQDTAARLAELVSHRDRFDVDPELRETVEEIGLRLRFEAARLAAGSRKRARG